MSGTVDVLCHEEYQSRNQKGRMAKGTKETGGGIDSGHPPSLNNQPFGVCPDYAEYQGRPVETELHAPLRHCGMDH
ncbi:hypothetical protein KOW87_03780 [Burkholderia semiarida]|jgi:hypothetical protein|nr:hypothetical protein [Burkholderia semiarida]